MTRRRRELDDGERRALCPDGQTPSRLKCGWAGTRYAVTRSLSTTGEQEIVLGGLSRRVADVHCSAVTPPAPGGLRGPAARTPRKPHGDRRGGAGIERRTAHRGVEPQRQWRRGDPGLDRHPSRGRGRYGTAR